MSISSGSISTGSTDIHSPDTETQKLVEQRSPVSPRGPTGARVLKNPLLHNPAEIDVGLARVLEGPTDKLARATRPAFLANDRSPVQWCAEDWVRMAAERRDLLDMASVSAQFDAEAFLLDGYTVFREVMTADVIDEWTTALRRGQQLNDALLTADWNMIDWLDLGRTPPEKFLTSAEIEATLGGSQQTPRSTDDAGVQTLRQHSLFAEFFPAGHVPFLMNVLTHPQFLELQRMCLSSDDIYFDHHQLLSRPGGYSGGRWHSHGIGGGRDDCGSATVPEYRAQPNINLTLCYPRGFEAQGDGGLKLVAGSHLFRDPSGCRAATDDEFRRGWLRDRRHPVTSKPLKIEHLAVPPGSIVCCLSHAAHGVAPRAPGRQTRWCSLYCYRKADDNTGYVQPPSAVPSVWAMKAQRGELPPDLARLLRHSHDRELTGGRTDPGDV
jgi:hypothetical protein